MPAIADAFGTPCYVYSKAVISDNWHAFDKAFGRREHLICYAVKANSNLAVLNLLARLGSGFDIVSEGELERVIRAGGDPGKTVFSGVGKTGREIRRAMEVGIHCFNVESAAELHRINAVASDMGASAPISLRVNPNIDPKTHPYIATGLRDSKFGVAFDQAAALYREAAALSNTEIRGIACHIGSQLTSTRPFVDALDRLFNLIQGLDKDGISLRHIDIGGGLGITYHDEHPPTPEEYVGALLSRLKDSPYKVLIEPGRAVVGNAGVLLTRTEYIKPGGEKGFAIVDAAMNDLLRPALYDAWHEIIPVRRQERATGALTYDVVGPVCETGDFLGLQRSLQISPGDLLAVNCVGAYGFVMSSNYNTRPRAAEVMVDGDHIHVIRDRETLDDLMRGERLLPE